MNSVVKYTLGRIALFVIAAAPLFLLPINLNVFIKLMIALVVSMAASFFLLRRWRNEVAERMSETARRRGADKQRLRAALAGEDEQPADQQHDRDDDTNFDDTDLDDTDFEDLDEPAEQPDRADKAPAAADPESAEDGAAIDRRG